MGDLRGWDFSGKNLTEASLSGAQLANTNFADAIITRVSLFDTTSGGLTHQQLVSTANFQAGDLRGIGLGKNDLTDWNFAGVDLEGADFRDATLAGADFNDAIIRRAIFTDVTPLGFTPGQFYSTASYKTNDLRDLTIGSNDLTGWDFSFKNLSGSSFGQAGLQHADFSGANLTDVTFATYYWEGGVWGADVAGASFRRANLTGADLTATNVTDVDFSDAVIRGASFAFTTAVGFTPEQLYSTASYQAGDLRGIQFGSFAPGRGSSPVVFEEVNLAGWNFAGKNLSRATFSGFGKTNMEHTRFAGARLTDVRFDGANLQHADFTEAELGRANYSWAQLTEGRFTRADLSNTTLWGTDLTNADFTDAIVVGADFGGSNLSAQQLYSTASYQQRDLKGIQFYNGQSGPAVKLSGWDLSGQNLTEAGFRRADLEKHESYGRESDRRIVC